MITRRLKDAELERMRAFRHIVERYQAEAIGHATAILGNHDDALDAVQEPFIDAFQALGQLDLSRRFYPWFYPAKQVASYSDPTLPVAPELISGVTSFCKYEIGKSSPTN